MGPGSGDQPLQVPGEPLGGLLVISPESSWYPPALVLRPRGQEWAAPQGSCCCSRKDLWCPQSPLSRGATPTPPHPSAGAGAARRTGGCGLPHARVVAHGSTHPRLGNKKATWPGAGATAASGHPGAGLRRGSAGRVRSGRRHGHSLSIQMPGPPVQLYSTFTSARYRRAPLCMAGRHGNPCPTPLSVLLSGQCHPLAGLSWTLSVPCPPPASLCEALGRLTLSSRACGRGSDHLSFLPPP